MDDDAARPQSNDDERRRKAAEALVEVGRFISQSLELEVVVGQIADSVRTLLNAQSSLLLRLAPESGDLVVLATSGDIGPAIGPRLVFPKGTGVSALAVRERRVVATPDLLSDPRFVFTPDLRARIEQAGYHALLVVPMFVQERAIGALAVGDRVGRTFDDEDIQLVQTFADQAAVALENAQLFQENRRRLEELSVLYEVSRAMTGQLDIGQLVQAIYHQVGRVMDTQKMVIFLYDENRQTFEVALRMVEGKPEPNPRGPYAFGPGLISLVAARRQGIRTANYVETCQHVGVEPMPASLTFPYWLGVPMVAGGQTEGLLVLQSDARPFTAANERLLSNIASVAALAVRTARLYTEAERRRREAEELARLARMLTESLDVSEVGERIVQSVLLLFDAHYSILRLLQPEGSLVAIAVGGAGREHFELGHVVPPGVGLVGRAVAEGRAIWSQDVLNQPGVVFTDDLRRRILGRGEHAFLVVPLRVKDEIIGVLSIADQVARPFSEAEVTLLQTFADQAALALENARLYEAQEKRAARLRSLTHLNQLISSSLDMDAVLREIAKAAATLMNAPIVSFYTADEAAQTLELCVFWDEGVGASPPLKKLRFDQGVAGWVATHRRCLNLPNVLADERFVAREWAQAHGLISFFGVPVILEDSLFAVLALSARQPFHFGPDDQDLLDSFVAQAAVAIRNARLYEERRKAHEHLQHTQEKLVQSEKLRALGEMAGGVAHDLNNTLAVILGRSQLLLKQTDEPLLQRQLQIVEQSAMDGARTVKRIQEFARMRPAGPFQPVDLNQIVADVVEITRSRWQNEAQPKGIRYDVQVVTAPLQPVAGDPAELREALTNLLLNALDAMPQGGRVSFKTGVDEKHVYCAVTDTGTGMGEEVRLRVFDPFFTTKGEKGSGLGLSILYGIVTRHGGEIEVQSQAGRGSTFILRLPVAQEVSEAVEHVPSPPPRRGGKILVIDDDEQIRQVLVEMLSVQGHVAAACGDGQSGLARLQEETFDLVITDLGMPGFSGWEVARLVKGRNSRTPVVLITGWADRLEAGETQAKGVDFLLAKPFNLKDVMAVVTQALAPRHRDKG